MEIVRSREAEARADRFDQIVFYLTDDDALTEAIEPLLRAGTTRDPAPHPYWRANRAVVFLDPDGRGVVYAPWIFGWQPDPADRNSQPSETAGRSTRTGQADGDTQGP